MNNWPQEYKLNGWLVSLKSGGKLDAHIHEDAWISGTLYIQIPKMTNEDEGNLVLCVDEEGLALNQTSSVRRVIDVSTGVLCLFPSSLLHYTIPFISDEPRIVLAFDVVPAVSENSFQTIGNKNSTTP